MTIIVLSLIFAVSARAGSVQRADRGGGFEMPAGDYRTAAESLMPNQTALATRIPMGEETLAALKNRSALLGGEGLENAVVEPAIGVSDSLGPLYASGKCTTNIAGGFAPSDIHGAVGENRLVVVTNVDIGVYKKGSCAIVSRVPLKTLFGRFSIPSSQTLFDPRVLYDRSAGRFFVTAESLDSRNTDQYQYFAVSKDARASGWWTYRFRLSKDSAFFCKQAADSFWDYPMSGKSSKRWFITANDFGTTVTGAVLVIDKAPTLSGKRPSGKCFKNRVPNIAAPIVLDKSAKSLFLSATPSAIRRYDHSAGATVGGDTLKAAPAYDIPDWSIPPDAVQPNGQKLDSIDGRFQSASIQSRDRIWNIHTVAAGTRPLIRWYRLRKSSSDVLSTVTVQSGSKSHLFNPSFVTNSGRDGSPAFITASRTIPPTCDAAGCRAAMMTFSGPNNSASGWTQSLAGTSSHNFATDGFGVACNNTSRGSCRWGDYSSIGVDPKAAGRAWAFNQLINGSTQFDWFTRGREEIYNLQFGPQTEAP
ncbi:MAG: hypothetical protein ACU837_03075 [Gammaproteobacteria bacterium]